MQILRGIVSWIIGLGGANFMPFMIAIIGMIFGMSLLKALRSGFLIGIGLSGITLVLGLLTSTMSPVVKGLVAQTTVKLDVIDVGWEMTSAAAWGTPYAPVVVPLGVLLNLLMLKLKWTKTLNVDIWNYWHFLFSSTLAYVVTGSFVWGLFIALAASMVTLWLADFFAPVWQEYFDLEGTSCTTMGNIASTGIMSWFFGGILNKIPVIKDVNWSPEGIQKRWGTLGEPMFIGAIVGAVIAIAAKLDSATVVKTGVALAAVLQLMPRMVQLLMEGLRPLALSAQESLRKMLEQGQETCIGMDIALGLGDATSIAAVIILVPIKLILAVTLPGNRWLPLASLASPYGPPFPAAFAKGDLLKTVIIGTIISVVSFYLGTWFAPEATAAVQWATGKVPAGTLLGGASGLHYMVVILLSRVVAPLFGTAAQTLKYFPK